MTATNKNSLKSGSFPEILSCMNAIVPLFGLVLAFVTLSPSSFAQAKPTDVAGTWTWSPQGRGGESREITLKIRREGDKYVGTLVTPGRGDSGASVETKIDSISVGGDAITFNVTREFQGNSFTSKYSGRIQGDTIIGKIEMDRDGQGRSRDWSAKRKDGGSGGSPVWRCDHENPIHTATSEAEMRELSKQNGCKGWHRS